VSGAGWRWPFVLSSLAVVVQLAVSRPFLAPCRWEELAIAFGLRQPVEGLSGVWCLLFAGLEALLPPEGFLTLLWLAGALAAGLLVCVCDRLFDWFMPSLLRARLLAASDGVFWKRVLTGGCALLFVCTDAVWSSCLAPGAALCQIAGTLLTVFLLMFLLRRGAHYGLPVVTFALGLLTGDGLFAALLFAVVLIYLVVRASGKVGLVANTLSNPIVLRAVSARAVCGYLAGLVLALVTNVAVYRWLGGVSRATTEVGDVLEIVISDPLTAASAACSSGAWVFMLIFVIVPLGINRFAIWRLWPKTGTSTPLFLLPVAGAAIVALTQATGLGCASAWLPTLRRAGCFAQAVWAFGGLLAVVWGLACLVARAASVEDLRYRRGILIAAGLVAAFVYATSLPTRVHPLEGELRDIVESYCQEVAAECAGDARVLTDGSLDAGVELAAWRRGGRLIAISTISGGEPHAVALRQRGVTEVEDLAALESGGADALRAWLEIRTNGLATVAAQAGFDRRRHFDDGVKPRYSGLVAHFGGAEGAAERNGRQTARALGRRIVELCRTARFTTRTDPFLLEAFRLVQWRVAASCRQRLGDPTTPAAELAVDNALADELDGLNPSLGLIRRRHGWQTEYHGALLLPREGVKVALAKADFRLAGYYAEQVLRTAPDDPEANFALGMCHYLNRQYARAIPNLTRVLKVQGENPGVLNNLAMAYLRLEKWDDAAAAAERARRAAPKDSSVRRSAERILLQARTHGKAPLK